MSSKTSKGSRITAKETAAKLTVANKKLESDLKTQEEEFKILKKEHTSLKRSNNLCKSKLKAAVDALKVAQDGLEAGVDSIETQKTEIGVRDARIKGLKSDITKLNKQVKASDEKKVEAVKRVDIMVRKLNTSENNLKACRDKSNDLADRLAAANDIITDFKFELGQTNMSLSTVKEAKWTARLKFLFTSKIK